MEVLCLRGTSVYVIFSKAERIPGMFSLQISTLYALAAVADFIGDVNLNKKQTNTQIHM